MVTLTIEPTSQISTYGCLRGTKLLGRKAGYDTGLSAVMMTNGSFGWIPLETLVGLSAVAMR